jgi:rhodanese-related sulfurtransferase
LESGVSQEQVMVDVDSVSVAEAWQRLERDAKAQLVDVRTKAEWQFVGVPDLTGLSRSAVLIEWQTYPQGTTASDFAERCTDALRQAGADTESNVFFICRSGARSLSAARVMAASGFSRCHNVAEGFEGPLDGERHRSVSGWKVAGLPWTQG